MGLPIVNAGPAHLHYASMAPQTNMMTLRVPISHQGTVSSNVTFTFNKIEHNRCQTVLTL